MKSLRSRIAASCIVVLLGAVALISVLQALAFRRILLGEKSAFVHRLSNEVASYIARDGLPPDLDRWASMDTVIQIDEVLPNGNRRTLRKSSETSSKHVLTMQQALSIQGRSMIVRVDADLSGVDKALERTQLFILIMIMIAVPLVVWISIALSRQTLRPIANLIATIQNIDSEKLDQRVDLTDRADELGELSRAFDAMLDRLQESFERERRFIANVSHELKTPLTAIHSNAQMLLRWAQRDEEVRNDSIQAIINESKGLGLLIEEMLVLAHIDSGNIAFQDAFDVTVVCGELVAGIRSRLESKPIMVELKTQSDPTQLTLFGNAVLLRRVFSNVLDNALKFTQAGEITVVATRFPAFIEVLVADTGIGIPADELVRIFERLYRTDRSRTRKTEGFGLGLSIAQVFIQIHGGTIAAEQREGGGTLIRVRLPVTRAV